MKKQHLGLIAAAVIVAGGGAWYLHQDGAHAEGASANANAGGPGARGKGGQPPAVVNVVAPQRRDVPVIQQANGTVTPIRTVDLHPQTTATIRQVHIKEGQFVKAGELLFSLDDRADRANLDKAQ